MPGTIFFRQNCQPVICKLIWLVLLCGLFIGNSLAATNEPTNQTGQTETKADLEKALKQTEKPVYPQTLKGAKQAYKDKNYLDSLKILLKLEGDYAGKVEYDYLLGRCALETNNLNLAVSAFTRVLTVDPDFAAARFELARTYYSKGVALLARGPFEQARSEFDLVSEMNPPPDLRQAINQYQANIDTYLKIRETEFNMFFEMTGGYDSNIASTSDKFYFSYYDYGSATQNTYRLDEKDREKESGYGQAQAGIGIAWPLFSNDLEIFGNLLFGGKSYASDHNYDHTWNQVQFGLRHYGKSDKKTIRFRFKQTDIDDKNNDKRRYHEEGEFMLEWAIKSSNKDAFTFWLLGGDSSYYVYETEVFSVNYNRQGIEWTHLNESTRKSSFQLLLMSGHDGPQECQDEFYCQDAYTRSLYGVRFAWSANIFDSSRFYSSLYLQYSEYDRSFFYERRLDRRAELLLATNTRFADTWYFRPELHLIKNDSSVGLYDHERWVASMTLGWGF